MARQMEMGRGVEFSGCFGAVVLLWPRFWRGVVVFGIGEYHLCDMDKLPVLISIPHGGSMIPRELDGLINLSDKEMLFESDAFTRDIYDLGDKAAAVVTTDVARALVDMNRHPEMLPPEDEDGVIKDLTTYGTRVFKEGEAPDDDLMAVLIERYYKPFHERIEECMKLSGVELGLDCHSMAAKGPDLAKDAGMDRPMLCLGNVHGTTCPDETLLRLKGCFEESFGLADADVALNSPFAGGYIVRTYSEGSQPWVQVELSRAMYLIAPWFDRGGLKMDKGRLAELRGMFESGLGMFFHGG